MACSEELPLGGLVYPAEQETYLGGMAERESRREAVLGTHREAILRTAAKRKVQSIALIGSVARGEDGPESDYDFLASFSEDASLFDQAGLELDLEELLGVGVDVVSEGGLSERHSGIRRDAIAL